MNFSIFPYFKALSISWSMITCLIWIEKYMIVILEILSLFQYRIVNKILPKLRESHLSQLEKSMSTYVIWDFSQNVL